jgi:two-component system cell cycle sensor histidine kinase/response regulator CckA
MLLATGNQGENAIAQSGESGGSRQISDKSTNHENEDRSLLEDGSDESPNYFEIVARATNDAVRDWNVKTGALCWPQGLRSLLGYEPLSGSGSINFWHDRLHPEDRDRVTDSIRDALTSSENHWSSEYRFRRVDGTYLQLLERALIERNAEGQAFRFTGSLMDITARKQLRDQLCRSQKMEAFGQLAGGLAHDFNNFLTTILGYSDLVLGEPGVKGAAANHVSEIRKAAGRASNLVGQLLAFSRKWALEPQVVEVNSLVTNLEHSLLRLLGENIAVICHLHHEEEGAHIRVDPGQITQIILNLAVNARDAMPNGGQLTLKTAIADLTDENHPSFLCNDFTPCTYVVISVTDTGTGMTEEAKSHLFEPFFTTRDNRSGLGLASSYGIVHQSGGHIRIESEEGKGTTAEIYLPKVVAPPASSSRKPKLEKLATGIETILVLEDDISVRHISVRVLRKLGYQVIEAANGDDAQRMITESAGQKIHLLLTDVVMPQISGRYFADWLRKISPHTKVVFVSGYLADSLHPGDRIDNGMFFLPKPFDPEQLATTIRQALDS